MFAIETSILILLCPFYFWINLLGGLQQILQIKRQNMLAMQDIICLCVPKLLQISFVM